MKQRLASWILLAVILLNLLLPGATGLAEHEMPPIPVPVRRDESQSRKLLLRSGAEPVIYTDKTEVGIDETFSLSWNEPDTDCCVLYVSYNDGEFESLGFVDTVVSAYECRQSEIGSYTYAIMTLKDGEDWKQSNFVTISVTADEETVCEILRNRGMDNTWNLLFMVYKNVSIGSYSRSFTDAQIASIRSTAAEMKYTMEGLSGGKMKIGTVDLIVVDEPVTSASAPSGYGDPPALTYGKGEDVDFTYILDHRDITLVVVVVPLLGMNEGYNWLGLGGTAMRVGNQDLYTVIVNEIYTDGTRTECYGNYYLDDSLAYVHEILHAVETNSRKNGWNRFQELHSGDDNGYGNGTYYWYRLLMSNTMDNGNLGFLGQSYYVWHYPVASGMQNGKHKDYDGVTRYYTNGLPVDIDLFLPDSTKTISTEAFINTPAKSVLIPSTVNSIETNAFNPGTVIYGKRGSYAESWASQNGYTFVRIGE